MSFGGGHLWLLIPLLLIVLIIWGPGKLPDIGAGLGRAIQEFRKATQEAKDGVSATPPAAPPPPPAPPAAPPDSHRDVPGDRQ